MTGSRAGRLCWLDFDGEETDENGQILKSATLDRAPCRIRRAALAWLAVCPINISGRPPVPARCSGCPKLDGIFNWR